MRYFTQPHSFLEPWLTSCVLKKISDVCFLKGEHVHISLAYFHHMPNACLSFSASGEQKKFGIRLALKFPDCILPKYKHFEDRRSCTSFYWVISDFPDEMVISCWAVFLSRQQIFLLD